MRHPLVSKIIQAYQKTLMIKIKVLLKIKIGKNIPNPNKYLNTQAKKINLKKNS